MDKAQYIADFRAKLGSGGILVGVIAAEEGKLTENGGTKTYQHYMLNYKSQGVNDQGVTVSRGATHHIAVYNEGKAGELALPVNGRFDNPAVGQEPKGSKLKDLHAIFESDALRNRTQAAMIKAAFDVLNEANGTANHANRMALAGDVFKEVQKGLNSFMSFIVSNGTVQSVGESATDNDIKFIVNSAWNQVADSFGHNA